MVVEKKDSNPVKENLKYFQDEVGCRNYILYIVPCGEGR